MGDTMNICSIDDCNERAKSRGYCGKHYQRWRAHGDPYFTKQIHGDDSARFESKYELDSGTSCWNWGGVVDAKGYGRFDLGGRPQKAHRVAYELIVGPIPANLTIDHLCRNKLCVNPDHLEPVTNVENVRRAHAAAALARTS